MAEKVIESQEILIVDDKPANIRLLSDLLQGDGFHVRGAPGGTWALKALASKLSDLIILDIRMPDMDGFEVCKTLKKDERTKQIPIIFISALDSTEDKVKALEMGGVDYITKPFEAAEVLARVKTHLLVSGLQKKLQEQNTQLSEEIALRKAQEAQLIQQSKMAAMGEMINVIAHQWKGPLSIIRMYAQSISDIIEYENSDVEKLQDVDERICEQVDQLNDIINDFRTFYLPSKETVDFKACELAADVFKLIGAKLKKLQVEWKVHEHGHFIIHGYPNEFKQALLNIYNNACDAFEENKIEQRRIELSFEHGEETAMIHIRDNAGGIPEAYLPDKLFDPYISTKGAGGTGIGLQITKTIIEEKFGGKISVKNVDQGAEFTIELPLVKAR